MWRVGRLGWVAGVDQGVEWVRSRAARLLTAISGGLPSANAATDGGRNAARAAHCTNVSGHSVDSTAQVAQDNIFCSQ